LIVHREYPPETAWGGIATFNYHLAREMKERGHSVDVLSFSYSAPSDTVVEGIRVKRIVSDVKKYPWDTSMFYYFWRYSRSVYRAFNQMNSEGPYDVVDLWDHLAEGLEIIKSGLTPAVLRLVSPWSWVSSNTLNIRERKIDIWGLKRMERACASRALYLNSPSRDLADRVMKFFNLDRPVEIIPNPIDADLFKPAPFPSETPLKVYFLGRLEPRKGPDILARAIPNVVREYADIQFTFVGTDCPTRTSRSCRKELTEYLETEGVAAKVRFQDPVPLQKLHEIYNSAHIVVVPSRYDTSPYVCQEAMACGRPVIGTSSGGMPEYLDHGNAGVIVPPEDPEALSRTIVDLAKNRQRREELGQAARNRVIQIYNRPLIAEKVEKLYCDAIALYKARGGILRRKNGRCQG
jgi:glycosyltransferase involved in cell wall biosynthesis